MPNIQEYIDRVRAPEPTSAGSSAFEVAGRHTEASFAEAGRAIGQGMKLVGADIQQHDELQDSNQITTASAKAFADMSADLSTSMKNADPNKIDQAADQWRQKQYTAIDGMFQDTRTSQGAAMGERMRATLRQEATRSSLGYQSAIAGQNVVNNMDKTQNYLGQAVTANPAMLPGALSILQGGLEEQLSNHAYLSAEQIAHIRDEYGIKGVHTLAMGAFKSMADTNPVNALNELEKKGGLFDGVFSGEDIETMRKYAEGQARMADTFQRSMHNETEKLQNEAQTHAENAFVSSLITTGPNGLPEFKLTPASAAQVRDIMSMPSTRDNRGFATWVSNLAKGKSTATDVSVYSHINSLIADGTATSEDVIDNADHLSHADQIRLLNKVQADPARKAAEKEFTQWANAQKPAFTKAGGGLGLGDPQGMAKWQQFEQFSHDRFIQAYEANPKGNWRSLLNQGSGDYLGKFAQPYIRERNMQLNGTVQRGSDGKSYSFTGHTPDEWYNKAFWKQQGQ